MRRRTRDHHADIAPNLHPILAAALGAIPEDVRPPGPYHLDGPRPKLTVRGIAEAALVCARHVRPHARGDAEECDRLIRLLGKAIEDDGPRDAPWRIDLHGARTIREHARGALKVTALACEAAYEDALRALDRLTNAIGIAMRLLDDDGKRALATALDRCILLSEARELARRAKLDAPVLDVLARQEGRTLVAHADGRASWLEIGERGHCAACTGTLDELQPRVSVGDPPVRVTHPRFGIGEIVGRDPGPPAKVHVRFADATRWLLEERVVRAL